jgi:hypothetical protein
MNQSRNIEGYLLYDNFKNRFLDSYERPVAFHRLAACTPFTYKKDAYKHVSERISVYKMYLQLEKC